MRHADNSLRFDCNYGCGQSIWVDTESWDDVKTGDGWTPAHVVHQWLGKCVMDALIEHHARCPEFYPQSGRPWLRLVKS